jgi:N-acyl-L-homoserine lactone synthetase
MRNGHEIASSLLVGLGARDMDWRPRPLGLPSKYPEGTAVGVAIEISEDTLDRLRATRSSPATCWCTII